MNSARTGSRLKHQCKERGGSGICPHGRRKLDCKECGGSAICPHGRQKHVCKECGGSGGGICVEPELEPEKPATERPSDVDIN